MMNNRSLSILTLLGAFLVGLLFVGTLPSEAQTTKTEPKKKTEEKAKADPGSNVKIASTPLAPPPPIKLTIASKDKDVQDTVKFINQKLSKQWEENKIIHSRWADDHEFIRRASLDIIGRIATPAEITEYFKDPADTRRSLLVDRLLAKPEYAIHWANVWSNWLLTRSGFFGSGIYHDEMVKWLEDQLADSRVGYDQIVRKLISATGKNTENGAVNFVLAHVGDNVPADRRNEDGMFEMVPITSRITRTFLGTQVQCAQCHDHPFQNNIKQKHFWGVNAFLRQVERVGNIPMQRQNGLTMLELRDNPNVNPKAKVFFEKRNGVVLEAKAEFLPNGEERGSRLSSEAVGNQRRVDLANYVVEHENFGKAIVNRMWGVFFGRGIIQPYDDFNDQNQPTNPELLNELASRFRNYNYDLRKLIRWIANSDAYNLSVVTNPTNDKQEQEGHFSRMLLKSMSPEQLFESLMIASNSNLAEKAEEKKKLREQWLTRLVSNFGDDEGNEVNFNGTVVQALLMMNGEDLNSAVTRKEKGTVATAIAHNRTPDGVISELYLAAFNRKPSARELKEIKESFRLLKSRDKDVNAPFHDLFWALLNSNEFILNH